MFASVTRHDLLSVGLIVIVGCTEPSPERLELLRDWGVTDYLKPPWTDGLRATRTALGYKLDEMSRFAETYGIESGL